MRLKEASMGVVIALHSVGSCALTLGALQGNSWVGRSLDVSVAAQIEAGQSATALCAVAEVFHADVKVDASRVRVLTDPTERADTVNLRVVSSAVVDEPVVTILLRVGCESEVTRRYVLLPDVPGEVMVQSPSAPPDLSVAPEQTAANARAEVSPPRASPNSTGQLADASGGSKPAPALRKSTNVRSSVPAMGKPVPVVPDQAKKVAKTPPVSTPARATSAPSVGRAKLTLDPLEILVDRVKTLESTTTPTQLEELVHTSQRVEQLQTDIKTLLGQAATNEANLRALKERLQKAEDARFSDSLVYLLAGLVILCVAGIVLFWRRSASLMRNLEDERRVIFAEPMQPQPTREAEAQSTAPTVVKQSTAPGNVDVDVDVSWLDVDEKGFHEIMQPRDTGPVGLSASQDPPQLSPDAEVWSVDFNSESQLALIDQAQRLVQLGKVDEATDILEKRIRQNPADCPLVFLEALHIANEHSLKTDFRQFSEEFQKVFNVAVPEFALFRAEGRSLDAYAGLLQHITKLGPGPKVLEVIESCTLLSAWGNNTEPFDLAAFKELVQLHGATLRAMRASGSTDMQRVNDSSHIDLDL